MPAEEQIAASRCVLVRDLAAHVPVGRLCFHLVEPVAADRDRFIFFITFIIGQSESGETQHIPLRAVRPPVYPQYTAVADFLQVLSLDIPFLRRLSQAKQLLQPVLWGVEETAEFLRTVPLLQKAGVWLRIPDALQQRWRANIRLRLLPDGLSDAVDAFWQLDATALLPTGESLSPEEWAMLRESTADLVRIRGQWRYIDRAQWDVAHEQWGAYIEQPQRACKPNGVQLSRWLAGWDLAGAQWESDCAEAGSGALPGWERVCPSEVAIADVLQQPTVFTGVLHAYQLAGVRWLIGLYRWRLGGILADEMGLGKTVQIIAFWAYLRQLSGQNADSLPHLLVAPAALLANWEAELRRFAPTLRVRVAHFAWNSGGEEGADAQTPDVVIVSYAGLSRLSRFNIPVWNSLILDEAQAVKNPNSQAHAWVRNVRARARFALTGTPVENRALDLWAITDLVLPGLLSEKKHFLRFANAQADRSEFYGAVQRLMKPYVLRRSKADAQSDWVLPEKTETVWNCGLSSRQIALYQHVVAQIENTSWSPLSRGQMRGRVLQTILWLKQICNHPDQYARSVATDGTAFLPAASGKWMALQSLVSAWQNTHDKVLVFTQFSTMIPPLLRYMETLLAGPGVWIDGSLSPIERMQRVQRFQTDPALRFAVLSLRAAGVGLNLTAANRVIHFDTWWNPAVMAQATDRAHRIGQARPVSVHHLICPGTIEAKIADLIQAKKVLADDLLGQAWSSFVLPFDDPEALRALVRLDLEALLAAGDARTG